MFNHDVDVAGEPVICQKWRNIGHIHKCDPGTVYRVDPDLELCVCKPCGQGWMRNVDAWVKLEEAMNKLTKANASLMASLNGLINSYQRLTNTLTLPTKAFKSNE